MPILSSDFEEKRSTDEEDWVDLSVVINAARNGLAASLPFHPELFL